jgi:D-sedoheptulose 7-phosphate isomerase
MRTLADYAVAISKAGGWGGDLIMAAVTTCRSAIQDNRSIFFIGNGGSASIASHMAADWTKTVKCRALCFNDPCFLTMFGNDCGFESIYTEPLLSHASADDILFAVSSSGQSANIVGAATMARQRGLIVITLSGFNPDNPLRKCGHINFFVPSSEYGPVEVAHLAICHTILDTVAEIR